MKNKSTSSSPAGGYRGGTRKGLDLTLGGPPRLQQRQLTTSPYFSQNPSDENPASGGSTLPELPPADHCDTPDAHILRGGALFRTLRRVSDGTVVSGPSRLVDDILRLSKAGSIVELIRDKWKNELSAFQPSSEPCSLRLKMRYPLQSEDHASSAIYSSPRIGLELSHRSVTVENALSHHRTIYISKPYRFFAHPRLLTANGRVHTFLGVYQSCSDAILEDHSDLDIYARVANLTGLTVPSVIKYRDALKTGLEKGVLSSFVDSKG